MGALLLFVPSHARSVREGQPPAPHLLLVTIDTLRADRLGSYGYLGARTPVLDALASSGVRFTDATAHAPLTHPSHAAILTGRFPGAFGIRLNGMDPLPDEATTLAERLRGRGYATGAIVASVVLNRGQGLAQGFTHYDDAIGGSAGGTVVMSALQRGAADVTARARAWLGQQTGPWFLWVHYYDPHLPYDAPAPDPALRSRPYDAEVAYVDREIGTLLAGIDRSRTLVVVTADHGEALGDHGEEDHGYFVYDSTIRVPLIVAGPGLSPRVVDEQVRSIDIAPTIAAAAGLSWEREPTTGEDLHPLLGGGRRTDPPVSIAESWYPRLHFGWSELRAIRVGEWKYIAAPKPELYDLRTDRSETRNLVADRPQVAARLAADLQRLGASFDRRPAAPRTQPDPEAVRRLQALGYVGSFAPVTTGSAAEDPKDRLGDYRQYRDLFSRALTLLGRNRAGEAATLLQRLAKLNVRAFEAHLYLGQAYFQLGRHQAALGEFEVASQLNPDTAAPHFEAAKALSGMGEASSAVARIERGLQLEPRSSYGNYTLGVIHQRAGQNAAAFEAFSRAVALNPQDPRARAGLGAAAMRARNVAVAAAQFEAMIQLKHQVALAQFNLGVIAAGSGNAAEATRRYRLALAADPAFKPALDALAKSRK